MVFFLPRAKEIPNPSINGLHGIGGSRISHKQSPEDESSSLISTMAQMARYAGQLTLMSGMLKLVAGGSDDQICWVICCREVGKIQKRYLSQIRFAGLFNHEDRPQNFF